MKLAVIISLFIYFFLSAGFCVEKSPTDNSTNLITNVIIKANQFGVAIFWDGTIDKNRETEMTLYRTTNEITNTADLAQIAPYKHLTNIYFYEDPDICSGVLYYYLVTVEGNPVVLPGKNENSVRIVFSETNNMLQIKSEIMTSTNENYKEFIKKFNQ
jgi:hypothetical protein